MYDFDKITLAYEYCSCVTYQDGHESSFRKVEHIEARRDNSGFLFTFYGSDNETIDGKEPEDWGAIFLKLGSGLYPYTLYVTADGKITGVKDFEEVKQRWMTQCNNIVEYYEYNIHVKNAACAYMESLESERVFISVLKRNIVYNLLFWNDDLFRHEVELLNFPIIEMMSIFSFEGGKKEDSTSIFKTDSVYDEGKNLLKSGNCTINIHRSADGLPSDISLSANLECLHYGYFKKEITLKRL